MATAMFEGVKITGLACAVPKKTNSIADFVDRFDIDRVINTTGIKARRVVSEQQSASDLCYEAAKKLIEHKEYPKDSFDGIILVTQTPDYCVPATAHILHTRLGLSNECMAWDINLGCSGFVYALYMAASMIQAGALKRILLCCGEAHSRIWPASDQSTTVLFGDAGSAVILEKGEDTMHAIMRADGSGYQAIIYPGLSARVKVDMSNVNYDEICPKMDGAAVLEFAFRREPRLFKDFFEAFGGTIDDYDYCVFHQANLFMMEHIRKRIHLAKEKMPVSLDRFGNTSSVSIPLTIADLCQRTPVQDRMRFIVSGFGIGLSWGIMDFTMEKEDILPIIETDEYFREAYGSEKII